MVTIKFPIEIKLIKQGGKRLSRILGEIVRFVKAGITTEEVDNLARQLIKQAGGEPAFLGYKVPDSPLFPSALCISINQEVVHAPAMPARALKDGDVVGLDIGMKYPATTYNLQPTTSKGLYTDMAVTVGIGKISREAQKLMKVTRASLFCGLKAVKPGNLVSDISRAIEKYVYQFKIEPEALSTGPQVPRALRAQYALQARSRYGIVRDLVGHGVGYEIHEEPPIPNYFDPRMPRLELKEGMVLAIEPMITMGSDEVKVLPDKWTVVTRDGSIAAHFEVTVVVTKTGHEVATPLP